MRQATEWDATPHVLTPSPLNPSYRLILSASCARTLNEYYRFGGMSMELGPIKTQRKRGHKRLKIDGKDVRGQPDLVDFWCWSVSDIVSNATRGHLAEYIVARAVGIRTDVVRDEWAAFDLQTESGIKIEVKSAAYVQSWHQNKLSTISFGVRATRSWNAETNRQASRATRDADVYVFALLAHKDKWSLFSGSPTGDRALEPVEVPRKVGCPGGVRRA